MLYHNKIWLSDLDRVLQVVPELEQLSNHSVLITGASGLICSAVIDMLLRYNDSHEANIHIIAAGRSYENMTLRFGSLLKRDDFEFIKYDAASLDSSFDIHFDYIIHGASNASPDKIVVEPVETMMSNIMGLKLLLDHAKENNSERVLYISSSEVYGQNDSSSQYLEDEYGYIDILQPRNSYSVAKRAAENLCASYFAEYGVFTVIARPGHIYGPTASKKDRRVSSEWLHSAAGCKDIVMKSDGAQIRSYCYCLDCASAVLKILLRGEKGKAYNISNEKSVISIKEMAEKISQKAGVRLVREVPSESEVRQFNPMLNSSLNNARLLELGWRGCFQVDEGIEHSIQLLKELYS